MEKRLLPIGIQDFEDLRKRGCIYVDKTSFVYKLATEGKPYFLSRPRRFGKSLLLSTMEYYFLGKKELFSGLAIENLETEWMEYPVIKISFGGASYATNQDLRTMIDFVLTKYEKQYHCKEKSDSFAVRFSSLIYKIHEETGNQVVVLIDEYDKPILDALYTEHEEKNRQELRNFYSPLKELDKYIHFLFITGITKVSHVNIFSGLNQLDDISMNRDYNALCGISESELEKYFTPEIEELSKEKEMSFEETKEKLASMYDGYHFALSGEGIYNPFCLLKCFKELRFGSYWFESGTPSLLVKTLQNEPLELSSMINGRYATEIQFKNYDPDTKNMLPVIYQSGYLTIKGYDKDDEIYKLDFPNREVEQGFLEVLLKKFITVPYDDMGLEINNIRQAIKNDDVDRLLSIIKAAIADLPTVVKKDMCENYYESVTHLIFRLSGFHVASELQTVSGRSDVVVATKTSVFIFELKMDRGRDTNKLLDEALSQIEANGYADRFTVSGKKLFKTAVVFSSDGKGMLGWKTR